MLCARENGRKCKPFLLLPGKWVIADVLKKYGNRASVQFRGTTWLNKELTPEFISTVIGVTVFHLPRRFIWESCSPYISKETKDQLRKRSLSSAVAPEVCTKYGQGPDVYCNSPFKEKLWGLYD